MKILLNASTLIMGGALQACVSFIRQSIDSDDGIEWHYIVSKAISEELSRFGIDIRDLKLTIINPSPARDGKSREELSNYISNLNPSVVFTFFGPAYINIFLPHMMGVADGWITHSTATAAKSKSIRENLRLFLLFFYKVFWYRKADRWVVEANCARVGMQKRFFVEKDSISIVSNSCSDIYFSNLDRAPRKMGGVVKILTLSAYYKHKNLEIIPRVASELFKRAPHLKFEFTITINPGKGFDGIMKEAHRYGVADSIRNIGPVAVIDGPELYANTDIVFMPSVLETFSAVYPEAMVSGCPIVTTDLDFSRDICADAACYYLPMNPLSAAEEILRVVNDADLFDELVIKGRERVKIFPTQREKYQLYVNELRNLVDQSR